MAVSFKIPKQPRKSIDVIDTFLGADFTNSPAGADKNKSPGLKNMIRDVPGKIRKCMGYETVLEPKTLFPTSYIFSTSSVSGHGTGYEWAVRDRKLSLYADRTVTFEIDILNAIDSQVQMATWYDTFGTDDIKDKIFSDRDISDISMISGIHLVEHSGSYTISLSVTEGEEAALPIWEMYTDPDDYEKVVEKCVNGFHKLRKDTCGLLHIGTSYIRDGVVLYSDANNHRSMSWEFDEHLYIVDGKKFLRYGLNSPKSDTVYKDSKTTNNVVVRETVTLVLKRFNKKQNILRFVSVNSSSAAGSFAISEDKTTITYTDRPSYVGQDITYSCIYEYRKGSSGSVSTGTVSVHHIVGIDGTPTYEIIPVEEIAYVPLMTIAKAPDGGGEAYYDLNLLSPAFTERFLPKQKYDSQGQIRVGVWQDDYYMSFDNLDEVEPIVKQLNLSTGEWQELTYGTDFTVDYSLGLIHFTTAPSIPIDETGAPIGQAEDTISITAYKTFQDYTDRINKCTIGTLFGVGGANDRLFLSGNPNYVNYDWYSGAYMLEEDEQDQDNAQTAFTSPTYYPDTGYSVLGSSASAIVGYSRVSNYLAAHKDKYERDQHIIIREGDLVDSAPTFRIINTLQGAAAVAPYSFGYLATEPLFLTEQGIYAVTAQDITGEKYAQNRSFYLDGKLLEEENLEDAYGFVYNDMYWLCLNDVAYILDGLQPMRSDRAEPYATRQYAGFYRTNIPANVMWEEDGRLFFGTKDGKVKRFFKDKYALESYNDDGEPIEAIWETGDLTGNVFFKNKTLKHIAVKLDSAIAASVNIFVMWRGLWNFVRTDHWRARQFQFSTEEFQYHTFSNDHTQRVIPKKVRFKNVDKFRLRLTNNELNESFALSDVGIEFTETDNYTR